VNTRQRIFFLLILKTKVVHRSQIGEESQVTVAVQERQLN